LESIAVFDPIRHDAAKQQANQVDTLGTYDDLLGADLVPSALAESAAMTEPRGIVGYQPVSLGTAGSLQLIHSADAMLGRNVDFTG
jgi:hypothetical protein